MRLPPGRGSFLRGGGGDAVHGDGLVGPGVRFVERDLFSALALAGARDVAPWAAPEAQTYQGRGRPVAQRGVLTGASTAAIQIASCDSTHDPPHRRRGGPDAAASA